MPLPAYFICSEGASVDREVNKLTVFNILEQIPLFDKDQLAQLPQEGRPPTPMAPMRLVSAWMKEDADSPDDRYECQFVFHFPQAEEIVAGAAEFTFVARFNRVQTPPTFIPGFPGPGILKLESRLRRVGETEWIARQFFYIELNIVDLSPMIAAIAAAVPSVPSA